MNETSAPKLSKIPFFVGDALLLATAAWVVLKGGPLGPWQMVIVFAAVAIGAWLAITPFIIQFRASMQFTQAAQLTTATDALGNLEGLAQRITNASSEWQHVHQSTTQVVTAADQIAEKMISEARNFGELLTRINETEKNHLRLEVEKLRRGEAEWLQVLVRILDHVYALHQAGVRSGQRNLTDQLGQFQNACRETARRLGLVAIVPQPDVPFDERQHQLLEGETAAAGAVVGDIIAPGYTFQGQLLRLPVVSAKTPGAEAPAEPEGQLSFGDTSPS